MNANAVETPPLAELQHLVWKLLTAPEGVKPGLAQLAARGEVAPEAIAEWFQGDERLDALGRLDIYANMYFYRLKDALLEDFERTAQALGEARFHNLVTDFLLAHPSTHPSVRWIGQPLPAFLAAHAYGSELPWVADLAALEWARGDVFQAEDTPVLAAEVLATVPPERWADLRFAPIGAVRLVRLAWDVTSLWERLEKGEPAGEVAPSPRFVLVYREDDVAHHEVLSPEEAEVVGRLLEERPFGEVCEEVGSEGDVDAAAARAATLLARWLEHGLLSGFRLA